MNTFRAMRTCAAQLLGKQEHAVEQLAERIASSVGASSSAALPFSSTTWSGWSASAGCLSNLATRTFASKGAGAGKGKDAAGRGSDIKSGASAKDALAAAAGAAPTALNAPVSKKPSAYPSLPLPPGLDSLIPPARPYELVPDLPQRKVAFPAQYVPWTPTRHLQRRRKISKRMAFLVQVLEKEHEAAAHRLRHLPKFSVGDVLEVHVVVPEAEQKQYLYRGVCIAKSDKGLRSSFKIYNVFPDAGGVVQHFPLYMPDLLGIKIVGRIHAAQSHLYHLLEQKETRPLRFQAQVEQVAASAVSS